MLLRPLGNTGLRVSVITLGTVELGMDYGFRNSPHYARPDAAVAISILHRAVEHGINFIDTAPAYGEAESLIGRVLPSLHPRPMISTKVSVPPQNARYEITASVERSLRTLGIDTIHLLQIHNATSAMLANPVLQETLADLQHQGKIRFTGASLYGESLALESLQHLHLRSLQIPFNFLDTQMARRVFPQAIQQGTAILARSAFLRGVLTAHVHEVPAPLAPLKDQALKACLALSITPAELAATALRFCLSHDAISTVLTGIRTVEELDANIDAAEQGPLSAQSLAALRSFAIEDPRLTAPTEWSGLI